MKTQQTIKQIMEFNKNAADSAYNALMNIGEQNEKVFRSLIDQAWIPEERKKVILEWVEIYRKGWVDFKKTADENYQTVVSHLDSEKQSAD